MKLFPILVENVFYVIDQCIFKITTVEIIFQKDYSDLVQGNTLQLRSRLNWKKYFLASFSFQDL